MMTIATTVAKQSSPVASRKKYPAPQRPSIEELKKKYEANTATSKQTPKTSDIEELKKKYEANLVVKHQTSKTPQQLSPKMLKKSKVKQMASMFNSKISQIIRRETDTGKYSTLVNELSPEPKPQTKASLPKPLPMPKIRYNKEKAPLPSPRTKAKAKAQQKSMYFVSEDNFAKLTVKDKAQLYTQFIDDMSKKNPKFGKHAELMEANVKKVVARGEVINEKQESVKHLREELEARCTFPKQTVSPLALQRINSLRKPKANAKAAVKSKEFEDIMEKKASHISTLTVTLQPVTEMKKQRRARSLPRRRRDHEQVLKELGIIEPSHKRNNDEMRSSLPIEAYAPPKKIRRTRTERLTPQIVFQNQQLEQLFFTWLRERQDQEQAEIVKESVTEDAKPKSSIDKLLEEAIAKLETVESNQQEEKKVEVEAKKISEEPRKKKPAPPVPTQTKKATTASSETSTTSSAKHSEAEECELGLTALNKTNSEDSQPDCNDKEAEHLEKDSDFGKPIKPLRKKKMRRTLSWKKDTFLEETHPITTTDSDSDSKICNTINKNKMLYMAPPTEQVSTAVVSPIEPSFVELDTTLMREVNSPRKIKSAYTLTAFSPTPCQQEQDLTNDFDSTECGKNETCHSWPSLVGNDIEKDLSLQNKSLASDLSKALPSLEPRCLADSFIDQGFETGNDMDSPIRAPKKSALRRQDVKVSGPLFIKLGSDSANKAETPSGFSTPIKGHLQQQQVEQQSPSSPIPQQTISPIAMPLKNRRKSLYDTESRRNSLAMQVIREDHPLEHHEIISPRNLNNTEQAFFANAPTMDMTSDLSALNPDKTSQFWIRCGDFSVSLDIYHNDAERVRLLYEIFSQRSCDTKDLHFGIDDQKFSVHNPQDQENISKRLPANKDCSHYWFSTGDLAIPFGGKRLSAEKIQRLFAFIKASVEETGILRFGVDAVEFSNVPEFWSQSPKFSMESNYSMLVGLQSGNSNGLEGRSKFAWPNSKPVRVSDLDQSDYECEDFEDNDSCRLSFSPFGSNHFDLAALGNEELSLPRNSEAMMNSEFGYEYENESLDQLFGDNYNAQPVPVPQVEATPVPEMLNTLKSQQERLSLVQTKLSSYNNPANLSSDALDALKGTPEYIVKLRSIVAEITAKGSSSGFKDCTVQELESYMFFLSRYADICLHSCSDHMEKVLDALLDQRAVMV